MFTYRPYQERAIQASIEYLDDPKMKGKYMLNVLPVAAGKSIIIAACAAHAAPGVLVIQPSVELLKQNYKKFTDAGGHATIYSASAKQKELSTNCIFATLGSIKLLGHSLREMGFGTVIIDECFRGTQRILTSKGRVRLQTLYQKYQQKKELPLVMSYNEDTKLYEYKPIINVQKNGIKEVYESRFSNGFKTVCTSNHPFRTVDGYRAIGDLFIGELVIQNKHTPHSIIVPNKDQISLIEGTLLGDGYKDENPSDSLNTIRTKIVHGKPQLDYIDWKRTILSNKTDLELIEENGFSKLPAYRFTSNTFYTNHKIFDRSSIIDRLTPQSLAITWMDDGSLNEKENGGTLYALVEYKSLVYQLCDKLKSFGISCEVKTTKTKAKKTIWYIYIFKKGVLKISELVAKFIHPSMRYKIHSNYSHLVGTYNWEGDFSTFGVVLKKCSLIGKEEVYNIEIQDNHNYLITNNKNVRKSESLDRCAGILVHNCDQGYPPDKKSVISKFMEDLKPKKVIGFTATPFIMKRNSSGSRLALLTRIKPKFYHKLLYIEQVDAMVSGVEKYWADLNYKTYDFDDGLLSFNTTGADYTEESIAAANMEMGVNNNIYKEIKAKLKDPNAHILLFAESVSIATKFYELFPEVSALVSYETPTSLREEFIDDFLTRKRRLMVNFGTLTTGFDCPAITDVIIGRPLGSYRLYYQIQGRGVRLHPDQLPCTITDLCGNVKRFGKIEELVIEDHPDLGWIAHVEGRLITGVPIGSNFSVDEWIAFQNSPIALEKVTFGKFKGKLWAEMPVWWLNWIIKEFKDPSIVEKAKSVLNKK